MSTYCIHIFALYLVLNKHKNAKYKDESVQQRMKQVGREKERDYRNFSVNDHYCSWHALKEGSGDLYQDGRGLVVRSAFHFVKFLPVVALEKLCLPLLYAWMGGWEKKVSISCETSFRQRHKSLPGSVLMHSHRSL